MRRVMNDFPAAWDAKVFGTVGPNLLWDTYESIRLESIHNGTVSAGAQLPRDVLPVVLAKNVYYPIKFKAAMLRNFFTRPAPRLPWYACCCLLLPAVPPLTPRHPPPALSRDHVPRAHTHTHAHTLAYAHQVPLRHGGGALVEPAHLQDAGAANQPRGRHHRQLYGHRVAAQDPTGGMMSVTGDG